MPLPQRFQYQGSQRALAAMILSLLAAGICVGLFVGCAAPTPQSAQESNPVVMVGTGTNAARLSPNSTPFNDYDSTLANSITEKWYGILNHRIFRKLGPAKGKVVVQFRLNADGTVSDLRTSYNDVGKFFGEPCEQAIKDCVPFKSWPPEMEKMVGKEFREITFTFYYYGK